MRVIPPIDIVPATFTRASTGTYLRHDGALVTAAVDEPRWNYGYADEPATGPLVNLVPYSEDFAAWVPASASVVPGAIASPYPGKLAAKIVESVSGVVAHYIWVTSGYAVVGQQLTLWAVVKPAERFWLAVRFVAGGAFPTTRFAYINTLTLAVSNGAGATGTATALSDGFVLVSVTATAEANGAISSTIFLCDATVNTTYAGDGVSGAYIARAQVNHGPVPQDYIETNGEAGYTPPAWVFKGLLQEDEATNLCLRSDDLSVAPWTGSCSATGSAETWHGVVFYTIQKPSSTSGESRRQTLPAVSAGESQTVTLALLAGSANTAEVGLYDGAAWGVGETSAEVLSGPGCLSNTLGLASVFNLHTTRPTVVRLTRTFAAAVAAPDVRIYPGSFASTTIGHSILATRVQVVSGLGDGGSYIPTTTVAVTRAADAMGVGMISSIGEPEAGQENAWDAATNWATGAVVVRTTTHKRYERLAPGGVDASLPESSPTEWLELGPSNQQAMWDLTNNQATASVDPIHVAVKPGQRINSIYLGNLAATDVAVTSAVDGDLLYSNVQNLRQPRGVGWYSYLFSPFAYRKNVALLDLPALSQAVVSASLIRTTSGQVQCGFAVLGQSAFIGAAQYSAKRSRRGFSTVERDVFGNATLTKRKAIPVVDATLWIKKELVNSVLELADELDAEPAAWLGLDDATDGYFDAISFVGVYQTLDVDVDYPQDAKVIFKAEGI